ncbi:unnamed protein product [Rotaria magnacalcarata]|uniref:PAW domain-containing protein n=2 Tax=Rotaria magnacalcarata TaxID=392030 RepID=A0A816WWZ6_9BILA|nr:unnamed protein product [Rotaria magnacalcarata]
MDLSFINNLRKINDEDDRLVTITLLIDIISNLLNDRNNSRNHTLPANYIQETFHKYSAAMDCLLTVGFKQVSDDYVFDQTISNEQLQELSKLLENELDSTSIDQSKQINSTNIDLGIIDDEKTEHQLISFNNLHISSQFTNLIPFVATLERVQSYEDINLRRYIRSSIIPLEDFNRKISNRKSQIDIDKRDLLLLELLRWFKEEFFTCRIEDIVSMLNEEKLTKESELHGRQSGSLGWKLARGETDQQGDITNGFIYFINNEECDKGFISIEYNSVLDKYYRNEIEENKKDGLIDKVYSCSNIQRKIENDWKMVYLSRKQLNQSGIISWAIQFNSEQEELYRFHKINIQCPSTSFDQYAQISCQLQLGDEQVIVLPQNSNSSFEYIVEQTKHSLSNIRIQFKVILTSSNDNNDDNAWQKAQLFRQSIEQTSENDQSHFLRINATIIKKTF